MTARQVRKMCAFYGYGGKFTPNHNNIPQALDWLTEKCFAVYEFGTPAQDIYCLTHGALSCMSKGRYVIVNGLFHWKVCFDRGREDRKLLA